MAIEAADFLPLLPEIFLVCAACLVLLIDLFLGEDQKAISYVLALLSLVFTTFLITQMQVTDRTMIWSGMFVMDPMAVILKIFICVITIGVFIYSRNYLIQRQLFKGEFFVLAMFAVVGMMVMVSAFNMLSLYLGLELLALSLYAMVAMQRESSMAIEAAMKYFVLGALASGLLLYGMSLIYGVTGTMNLQEVANYLATNGGGDKVLMLGLVFSIVGLAFKLGAVPFHMWVPDVYHGAPTAVTLFIGTAPKIAGFAMIMRLLADGLGGMYQDWQGILVVLALLSIIVGNVVAIAQTNIKRMFAYSTIAHMGFLFLGILSANENGYAASMFYTIAYAIMGLGGFGMIILLSRAGFEADSISDFKGLNDRSPWFAFMMLILMFSMAGVPPTLGFYAKLAVLEAAVNAGYVWLAVAAVVFSIVGAFYYLRVVWYMYFDKPIETHEITASPDLRFVLSANSIAVLLLGIFPGSLLAWCVNSIL